MKYFVLHLYYGEGQTDEFYLKGKSMKHMYDRINRYSDGQLYTSKGTLFTSNITSSFLREVDLRDFPILRRRTLS